jgi:hypothetical protein
VDKVWVPIPNGGGAGFAGNRSKNNQIKHMIKFCNPRHQRISALVEMAAFNS